MTEAAPRVLFVPVSGRFGMGEYARAATLARAVLRRWPGAAVRFVLSRAAPYARSVDFPTTWVEASATFHSREVIALLDEFRPHLVVFDNAGRTAQLAAARRLGAHVVFVSSRPRQRARAFRWRWMRLMDEHWIAYPAFLAGPLGAYERLKLKVLGRPRVRFLDVVMARPAPARGDELLAALGLGSRPFVLIVPGGGTGARDQRGALGAFEGAAERLAAAGVEVLYAGTRAEAAPAGARSGVRYGGPLPQADLAALFERAQAALVNGGSTLLQAIACGAACIAAPIAGDQPERIRRCVAAGLTRAARLEPAAMAQAVRALLDDPPGCAQLRARAAALALADGVETALEAMSAYLGSPLTAPAAVPAP